MALFAEYDGNEPTLGSKRRSRGWLFLALALLLGLILGSVPAPYVIEFPGPVFNTLGTTTHDNTEVPLISIPEKKTYPTDGTLDLLTVSVIGNPDELPNWFEVARAWFDPSKAVLPVDQVYSGSETTEERNELNQELMVNSQQDAIAAAFTSLGTEYTATLTVMTVMNGAPASGILHEDDVITSVNGTDVANIAELREEIAANGTSAAARIGILRSGKELTVEVTPTSAQGAVVLGIGVGTEYTFPFEVDIQLDNVGGPSAGMMFALGIIDKLTPGELNGGENVAGTGTIDAQGSVGPIGGIRQKLYGAKNAGASWFFAPVENCPEVTGHVPEGLTVVAVKTLHDSLEALKVIKEDSDASALPSCPASH